MTNNPQSHSNTERIWLHLDTHYSYHLNLRGSILQTLQIRESESSLVSRLFIFEFFQGASIAIYFTAAISIFLEHLPAIELPKVFILSAVILWIFGFIYSKLEHALLTRQLIIAVLLFNGFIVVFFRLFMNWQDEKWFLYIFLASFNILYLLNSLEFWGLVALMFDVRQSKRLFSIVSAGDVPAKMIGYLMALAFSSIIGIENLLWISAGCVMTAGLLFVPLSRSDEMKKLAPTKHHHYATQSLQNVQASIRGNTLIRQVALVSFFSFCFYIIVNFVLYGYIKDKFYTDKSLAIFFSIFFAVSRAITLVVKLLFTNRLVNRIGLRKALLIAPTLLLVISAVTCSIRSSNAAFYLFGVMAVSADILRSAIQSPVLLATLQPLPAPQRLRGHTVIKGLMDPFAFFASGILLIIILASPVEVDFVLLSIILLFVTGFWMISCLFVDKNYIKMLTTAIRKRMLDGRSITITDSDSLNFLMTRMERGDEKEAISVLQLVSSQPINHEKFYLKALDHNSVNVRKEALQLILDQHYQTLLPDLKQMMNERTGSQDLQYFVRVVGLLDKTEDISSFLQHTNDAVANAAVVALLLHTEPTKKTAGENHLLKLFESHETDHHIQALRIVSELKADKYSEHVYKIIREQNKECRYHALQTAGILGNEKLIDHLLSDFLQSEKDHDILRALHLAGDAATIRIQILLYGQYCSPYKRHKLFSLLGKIGGNASISLLQKSLEQFPEDSGFLISILYHLKFRSTDNAPLYKKLIVDSLETALGNIFRLNFIRTQSGNYSLLERALELELTALRERCIHLFSFLYDEEKIRRAKSGFDLNTKDSTANSFELIERTVPREYSILFTTIFEYADLPYKIAHLKKIYKLPAISLSSLIQNILLHQSAQFNDWTKACVLYNFKDQNGLLSKEVLDRYMQSDNPIIKEITETISKTKTADYPG